MKHLFSNANKHSLQLNYTKYTKLNLLKFKSNTIFHSLQYKTFNDRREFVLSDHDMKIKLMKKHGIPSIKDIMTKQSSKEQYMNFVEEQRKRKLDFNRKNRWEQRELDDIFKNFDLKQAKFKDYSSIQNSINILNTKKYNSIDEIFFFIEEKVSDSKYISEDIINNALDVFIKDFNLFEDKDLNNPIFKKFTQQVIIGLTSYTNTNTLLKAAKFFDWYNIINRNCWFNMEKVITNIGVNFGKNTKNTSKNALKINSSETSKELLQLIEILGHFANQGEGSQELYDLFQYYFWSGKFNESGSSISEYIALGYYLFQTSQGYDLFYHDLSKTILEKLDYKVSMIDLMRLAQIYTLNSRHFGDIYFKMEEIILKRSEIISANDASIIACSFSISNFGTFELY